MHDLRYLRSHREEAAKGFAKKNAKIDLDAYYKLEEERLARLAEVEELKRRRNEASEEIGKLKKAGQDASALLAEMKTVGEALKEKENLLDLIESRVHEMVRWMPNFPHESVPEGKDATGNGEVAHWGPKPEPGFTPRPHWEVAEELGWIDFTRGPKIAGSGFPLFVGYGARLVRALIQMMIDIHTTRHGYTLVHPPVLVRSECLEGTGQLPKLADDMYRIPDEDLWARWG